VTSYWACARTENQREQVAQHFLGLRGFQSYLPRLRIHRQRHGRKLEFRPCLFPNYIFFLVQGGHWWNARWCPAVASVILSGGTPAVVADAIIAEIRARERNGLVELPTKRETLHVGDQVRILQGPFVGLSGLYQGQRPHQRVLVLLALLGRVELAKSDVEAV
jgi:transcriptional antiterminator RfaH